MEAAAAPRSRLEGHLELIADAGGARGETRLRRQSFRAPIHLSKPFRDGGALVLNLANPTAGFLDGDRLRMDVRVERGARLVLATPAATRIHTMRGGRAEVRQRFRVESGGSLEYWPELLIPQRGARYRQETEIELEPGAELLFFETLAPGRTAMGEAFAYDELIFRTDLRVGEWTLARERFRLSPGDGSLAALRRQFPRAYYASAFLVAPGLDGAWQQEAEARQDEKTWIGASALGGEGAYALKMAAADSLAFRAALRGLRGIIYTALGRPAPDLRRAGD